MKTTTHLLRNAFLLVAFAFSTTIVAQESAAKLFSNEGAPPPIGTGNTSDKIVKQEVEFNLSELKAEIKSIVITNAKGVVVNPTVIENIHTKTVKIDTAILTKGTYFLVATDSNNQTITREMVKQ